MLKHLDDAIHLMNTEESNKNLQDILFLSTKFAVYFEFLYGAMNEDPDEIFYQNEPSEDIKKVFEHYEYCVPEDLETH